MSSYSVQWELVKVCVKWLDTADTSREVVLLMEISGEIADMGKSVEYLEDSVLFNFLSKNLQEPMQFLCEDEAE